MITNKNVLKFEKRREIYSYIDKNPGLHLRELSRRLNIPKTTLKHHTRYLEKVGLIKEVGDEKYKRFFICDDIYTRDKEIFSFIRKEIPLRIFLYLCSSVSFSQIELAEELNINYKSLSYYIKKLLEMGIIKEAFVVDGVIHPFKPSSPVVLKRKPVRSEKIYIHKDQESNKIIERVLIAHKDNLTDKKIIDSYLEYLKQVKDDDDDSHPLKNLRLSFDSYLDNVIGLVEDYFKPPFCS